MLILLSQELTFSECIQKNGVRCFMATSEGVSNWSYLV